MTDVMSASIDHSVSRQQRTHASGSWSANITVPGLEDLTIQPRRGQALRDLDNMTLPGLPSNAQLPGKDVPDHAFFSPPPKLGESFMPRPPCDSNDMETLEYASSSSKSKGKGKGKGKAHARARALAKPSLARRCSGLKASAGVKAKGISRSPLARRSTSPMSIPHARFSGVTRIPKKLPQAPVAIISSPFDNLAEHLRRHGLAADAKEFAGAEGITPDFILQAWTMGIAHEGPMSLLNSTNSFMEKYGGCVHAQLGEAQRQDLPLPSRFTIPVEQLTVNCENANIGMLPTHILAIHGRTEKAKGFLVPAHGLVYVLQCASLPSLSRSRPAKTTESNDDDDDDDDEEEEEETMRDATRNDRLHEIPVVGIIVPRPEEFAITHRFLYTRDASTLLNDLLPVQLFSQYARDHRQKIAEHEAALMPPPMHASQAASSFRAACKHTDISSIFAGAPALSPSEYSMLMGSPFDMPMPATSTTAESTIQSSGCAAKPRSSSLPSVPSAPREPGPLPKPMATCAVEALAALPIPTLLDYAYRIHSSWANGVAIGVLSETYWTTLDRAWAFVVAALDMKKKQLIDAEERGMKLGFSSASEQEL